MMILRKQREGLPLSLQAGTDIPRSVWSANGFDVIWDINHYLEDNVIRRHASHVVYYCGQTRMVGVRGYMSLELVPWQ